MTQQINTENMFDEERTDGNNEENKVSDETMYEEEPKPVESELDQMKKSVKLDETEAKKALRESKKALEEEKKVHQLYEEFDSFLQKAVKITPDDSEEKQVIPTGIDVLDAVLGGGFAVGAMSMILGTPGCGKSMLVAQVLANAQKIVKNSFLGTYLDSEESTTAVRLWNLGVRNPRIRPKNDITIEKVFKVIEGTCMFKDERKLLDTPSLVMGIV